MLRHIHTESDGLTDRAVVHVRLRLPSAFDVGPLRELACRHAVRATVPVYDHEPATHARRCTILVRAFNVALRKRCARPRHKLKTDASDMNVVRPRWGCPILA